MKTIKYKITNKAFLKQIKVLEAERERINIATNNALIGRGWTQTEDTPGHFLRYEKPINGRVFIVDARDAVLFEKAICKDS